MYLLTPVPKSHQLVKNQKNKVKWECINNVSLDNVASVLTATRFKETKK
jgi:hypothetical protein